MARQARKDSEQGALFGAGRAAGDEPAGHGAGAVRGAAAGQAPGAERFVPRGAEISLNTLRDAAQGCRGCQLYKNATQAVFGEGPRQAEIMMIGEQPGDQEDLQGRPFVGPAGAVLRRAMEEAGLDVETTYITNAVKHFKWTPSPRGKRRLHSKPSAAEVQACKPWLEREVGIVKPRVLVLLGATAAQAVLGGAFRVSKERGKVLMGGHATKGWASKVIATVHPSSVLRAPDDDAREEAYRAFAADLRVVAQEAKA